VGGQGGVLDVGELFGKLPEFSGGPGIVGDGGGASAGRISAEFERAAGADEVSARNLGSGGGVEDGPGTAGIGLAEEGNEFFSKPGEEGLAVEA